MLYGLYLRFRSQERINVPSQETLIHYSIFPHIVSILILILAELPFLYVPYLSNPSQNIV
jgi:hypothetical protein